MTAPLLWVRLSSIEGCSLGLDVLVTRRFGDRLKLGVVSDGLMNVSVCVSEWRLSELVWVSNTYTFLPECRIKQEFVRPRWPYDMRPSERAEKYICVIVIR